MIVVKEEMENKELLSIQQMCMPFMMHNDFNRVQMACSHHQQAIPLVEMEPPRIQSIYNKDMVHYSDMCLYAKEDCKNLGKFRLHNEEFLLLLYENELELVKISREVLDSAFTAYHTYVADKVKTIKKGSPILITGNSDKDGNLQIGRNALVAYMLMGHNIEDAAIISESFSKKLTHIERSEFFIMINKNEYLLNLYGDDENYKCLPDIGDEINPNSRIVCVKRSVKSGWKSFMELSKNSKRTINFFSDDIVFYGKGKVVDISAYSNLEDIDSMGTDFHKDIKRYIDRDSNDIKRLLDAIDPYIKRHKDKKDVFKFGTTLQYYYTKYRKVDNGNIFEYKDKQFDGILIKLTLEFEQYADIGSKISNTCGGKSVVTMILPDDQMPIRKRDGKPADVIFSPNSVIGRLNLGQIHETTINRIAEYIFEDLVKLKDDSEKFMNLYLEFMKDLLPMRLHDQLKQIEKLKGKKLEAFINSIIDDGYIKIPQVPMETVNMDDVKKWYQRYDMDNDEILINGKQPMNKILFGYQYILKLKHIPSKKLSAASYSSYGSKSLLPRKDSGSLKKHIIPVSQNPNTIGEQESSILMALSKDMNVFKELVFLKASDVKNREKMLEMLLSNEEISLKNFDGLNSIAVKNLNFYLKAIGLSLDK